MAGPGAALRLFLVLLLLRGHALRAAPAGGDARSLSYTFTIPLESSSGQSLCDVQGQLDADNFLSYDCRNDIVKNMSVLGKMSDRDAWEDQIKMLKEAGDLFRYNCPDIKLEKLVDRGAGSVYLQVMLTCQRNSNGDTNGFWEFGLNGQKSLIFHPENEKWEMVNPGGKSLKEKWEKDHDMIPFLKRMSLGDCKKWLKDFGEHLDRNAPSAPPSSPSNEPGLGVLARNSTDVSISAPSNTTSSPPLLTRRSSRTGIFISVAFVIVIFSILFYYFWEKDITVWWGSRSNRICQKLNHQ